MAPLLIYYEHPDWFRPLFTELERRGIEYDRVNAGQFQFDPSAPLIPEADPPPNPRKSGDDRPRLVFNRMSPSAWKRGRAHAIFHAFHYLHTLAQTGVPVVNGAGAFTVETSKALQISLIHRAGLLAPRTRVVHHPTVLPTAAAGLEFPLVVKPNIGGSGAGIVRFDRLAELEDAVTLDEIPPSIDGVLLLQEFHAPAGGSIVRVETLAGRVLYGIRVHIDEGAGFDLCPADICRDTSGRTLESAACPAGAGKAGLRVEAFEVPDDVRLEVEGLADDAGLDVGGVEFLDSTRDGRRYYYDVNALSNFVADPVRVLGFDPHVPLVNYLASRLRETERLTRSRAGALRRPAAPAHADRRSAAALPMRRWP